MFDPPFGHTDLAADVARLTTQTGEYPETITVGDISLRAKRPTGIALGIFAAAVRPKNDDVHAQTDMLARFVIEHLSPESWERLLVGMLELGIGVDKASLGHIVRKIATLGTARPYYAVTQLACSASMQWRSIRARLVLAGIADPLADIPDMHAILDVVESMMLESCEDVAARTKLLDTLYKPDIVGGETPQGFDEADTFDSFAAFEAAASSSGFS